ncbi:MAG: hypothetical protein HYY37_00925 [Candidatus Aenigmarchaeota archaeon]|nr:hypothetical protein [Candidatus Aenigmarchaeota archaeon]
MQGKAAYLSRLYSRIRMRTANFSEKMSGSSPPSVFVGRFGYPKVFVGPLLPHQHGDTSTMDLPESWLGTGHQAADVIDLRTQLVRGKQLVGVRDRGKTVEIMQSVALAKRPLDMQAEFEKKPVGRFIHEEAQPFGPSAPIRHLEVSNEKLHPRLEKFYHDTDAKAAEAVITLYEKDLPVSTLQKALSVGAFGMERNRRLVPTRWSITAVDDTLSKHLLEAIRTYPVIEDYQVYEYEAMNNYFAVLLMPMRWQYESMEAFMHIFGREELLFSDWEPYGGRKEYAAIGGCYYSGRLAIAEKLHEMGRQAGAIVFRDVYSGYIPLGVWLVRECMRNAMNAAPKRFSVRQPALAYISSKLRLPFWRYRQASALLKQRNLAYYAH